MQGTSYLINIVDRVLHHWGVKASRQDVRRVLCSNPWYPSIKSLHDTLAYYGLESNVYQADFEHLTDLPHSVIHTQTDGGHFYYLQDINEDKVRLFDDTSKILSKQEFLSLWDGVVMLIEGDKKVAVASAGSALKLPLVALFVAALLLSQVLLLWGQPYAVLHLLLDAAGIAMCCVLYGHLLFSYVSVHFCHISQRFDCSAVSAANPLQRFLPFPLPVAGLAFFLFDWLLLLLRCHNNYFALAACVGAAVFMLTLFAYQLFVVHKYCLYCMGVSAVVFAKPFSFSITHVDNLLSTPLTVLSAALITLALAVLIHVCGNNLKFSSDRHIKLLTFKRIPGLFNMLLGRQPLKPVSGSHALLFGNESAKITLDTVVSLNCRHCRLLVKQACTLIEHWPDMFCWRVYIDGVSVADADDTMNARQLHLVTQYIDDRQQAFRALKQWRFAQSGYMVSASARQRYAGILADIRQMGIEHYPTLLFNSRLMPDEYTLADIDVLINDWQS